MKRRPIKIDSFVWCDQHGTVHGAEPDFYSEGDDQCRPANWRPVYVLGEPGETF